ncbi:MAG TPA: TfuA-like protein [Xanthobacteraceae bacterium]|nr:TfuA-like protein [Xanthobacteraceae bacterium]
MTGRIVVFLGPTMPRPEAAAVLEADYRPPAEQGALVRAALEERPQAVVLIDGQFGRVPAIRHKEILWTLAQGIPVYGAASMGALRAAELGPYGMRGHGLIYRWYRRTPLADDDAVAVAMAPVEIGGAALGEALVNMRLTLRRAVRAGVLPVALRAPLAAAAGALYFLDRSYENLIAASRGRLPDAALDRLAAWIPGNAVDQKRADALGLLRRLAETPVRAPDSVPVFEMTEAFAHDLDAAGLLTDTLFALRPPERR